MRLNTLKPAFGSKKKRVRVGRGMGSGFGKTCGRGHKGQKARSGYAHKIGFEGGQMPLQRRIPKFGFTSSKKSFRRELQLGILNKITADTIDLAELKKANLIQNNINDVKIILGRDIIKKPITLIGIRVTASVRKAIETIGGKIK